MNQNWDRTQSLRLGRSAPRAEGLLVRWGAVTPPAPGDDQSPPSRRAVRSAHVILFSVPSVSHSRSFAAAHAPAAGSLHALSSYAFGGPSLVPPSCSPARCRLSAPGHHRLFHCRLLRPGSFAHRRGRRGHLPRLAHLRGPLPGAEARAGGLHLRAGAGVVGGTAGGGGRLALAVRAVKGTVRCNPIHSTTSAYLRCFDSSSYSASTFNPRAVILRGRSPSPTPSPS